MNFKENKNNTKVVELSPMGEDEKALEKENKYRKIIEELGLEYVGIQKGFGKVKPSVLFNAGLVQNTTMCVEVDKFEEADIKKIIEIKIKETKEKFNQNNLKNI